MHERTTASVSPETPATSSDSSREEAVVASIATELYKAITCRTPPLRIGTSRGARRLENARHFADMIIITKRALLTAAQELVPQKPLQARQPDDDKAQPNRPEQEDSPGDQANTPIDVSTNAPLDGSPDNTDDEAALAYLRALNRGTSAAQHVDRLRSRWTMETGASDDESDGTKERKSNIRFGDEIAKRQKQITEFQQRQAEAERAIAARRAREMDLIRAEMQKQLILEKLPIWVSKFREPLCFFLYVLGQTPGQYMTLDEMIVALEAQSIEVLVDDIFPEIKEPEIKKPKKKQEKKDGEQAEQIQQTEGTNGTPELELELELPETTDPTDESEPPNRREIALEAGKNFLKEKKWTTMGDIRDDLDEIASLAIAMHQDPFRIKSTMTKDNSKAYALVTTDALADYDERSQAASHAWGQANHDGVSIFDHS